MSLAVVSLGGFAWSLAYIVGGILAFLLCASLGGSDQ